MKIKYRGRDYNLNSSEVELKNGVKQKIYYFSLGGEEIDLPEGYEVYWPKPNLIPCLRKVREEL